MDCTLKLIEQDAPLRKIVSLDDLCNVLQVKKGHLLYICYKRAPSENYRSFDIPKKRGGTRRIDSPIKGLGLIQSNLAKLLTESIEFKSCVKGFVSGEGIRKNAFLHRKSAWVLNVDIENFFGTINFGRVRASLMAKPFSLKENVASVIAQICCHENKLPQGAPTSPVVANIIASMLDTRLLKVARKYRLTYSRYADDITLSAKRNFPQEIAYMSEGRTILGEELKISFERAKFNINPTKTRLQYKDSRQEVTGIIVNKKLNVPAQYKHKLRAAIKQWQADPEAAERRYYLQVLKHSPDNFNASKGGERLKQNIYGRLSFISMIKGADDPTFVSLALKMAKSDSDPPKFVKQIKKEHQMYDVFLCHASEDKEEIVRPLYEELTSLGLTVFLDEEEITWGQSLIDVINKALHKSKYVIAVMSENSVGKKWPQKEINAVLNSDITKGTNKLLPLISGNAEVILSENYLLSDKLYKTWQNNAPSLAREILSLIQKN